MPKFKITFCDVIEADHKLIAYDEFWAYLKKCVEMKDITAFGFQQESAELRETTMPKFKVTATMDVGYELIVEAPNADTAWQIAKDADDISQWVKADDGHDWTLENVHPVSKVEMKDE